jgi:hypothetical protein
MEPIPQESRRPCSPAGDVATAARSLNAQHCPTGTCSADGEVVRTAWYKQSVVDSRPCWAGARTAVPQVNRLCKRYRLKRRVCAASSRSAAPEQLCSADTCGSSTGRACRQRSVTSATEQVQECHVHIQTSQSKQLAYPQDPCSRRWRNIQADPSAPVHAPGLLQVELFGNASALWLVWMRSG